MSFHYGQSYSGGGPQHHPPPGAPRWGSPTPGGPAGQYGGATAPPGGNYGRGAAPGSPYGAYGAQGGGAGQYGQAGGGAQYGGGQAPGAPYGGYGQPQRAAYGQQAPAGNLPPGVHPEAQQWFNTVDTDRSGYINQKELKQALLNSNSTPFNDETCQMMFNMFDTSRSGRMDQFGFSALWMYLQQWKGLFQQFDRDRSGSISGTEMHQALSQMGYNLSPQFIQKLVGRFSPHNQQGAVYLDRFIQVCSQLQTMTHAFRERDTGMTGNVRMNYEDFLGGAIGRLM